MWEAPKNEDELRDTGEVGHFTQGKGMEMGEDRAMGSLVHGRIGWLQVLKALNTRKAA